MTETRSGPLPLHDFEPETAGFRADVLAGLGATRKSLPCKYFYDERGSALFERICELEEYYPTRTELSIMESHAGDMADVIGPGSLLVEFGSGSSRKTRLLLDELEEPAAYVPVDISRDHLIDSSEGIAKRYPALEVLPVCADFTQPFALPDPAQPVARRVIYFPGSTIGNFARAAARELLTRTAGLCGEDGGLLIGIDLDKDPATLELAYDDAEGVTAEFNLNLLHRINRELGADFDVEAFSHRAVYEPESRSVEIYLVSDRKQSVRVGDRQLDFEQGERIHTESSHKYTVDGFSELAGEAGFALAQAWTDPEPLFAVLHLERD